MCGIAGFNLSPAERLDSLKLARALVAEIESRGYDATGAAWVEDDGVFYDKAPERATIYARHMPLHPLTTNAILHTRWATQGDPAVNANNHPFALPGIIGVHNGVIYNDADVFEVLGSLNPKVKRTCATDSEAIFALLAYSGLKPTDALTLLDGDAAIAWLDTDEPDVLHLATTEGRPLWVGDTEHGSLVFASTEWALRQACRRADVKLFATYKVPSWTYMTYRNGAMVSMVRFEPARRPVRKPRKKAPSRKVRVEHTRTATTTHHEGANGKKFAYVTAKREPIVSSGKRQAKVVTGQVPMWDIDPVTGEPFDTWPEGDWDERPF